MFAAGRTATPYNSTHVGVETERSAYGVGHGGRKGAGDRVLTFMTDVAQEHRECRPVQVPGY